MWSLRRLLGDVVFVPREHGQGGHHYRQRDNMCKCPAVGTSSMCSQISEVGEEQEGGIGSWDRDLVGGWAQSI